MKSLDQMAAAYERHRIFPLVDNIRYLEEALSSPASRVIVLGEALNLMNLNRVVRTVHQAGKLAMIDIDLLSGLSEEEAAVHYLIRVAGADGIITRQKNTLSHVRKNGAWGVLKVFANDPISLNLALSSISACRPMALDIIPGAAAGFVLHHIRQVTDAPVGISGFYDDSRESVRELLQSGISAVHTRNRALWGLELPESLFPGRPDTC